MQEQKLTKFSQRRLVEGPLTPRQQEVMRAWLIPGATRRTVAPELCISTGTLISHLIACYQRLGVNSRKEAAERFAELYPVVEPKAAA